MASFEERVERLAAKRASPRPPTVPQRFAVLRRVALVGIFSWRSRLLNWSSHRHLAKISILPTLVLRGFSRGHLQFDILEVSWNIHAIARSSISESM